MTSIMDYLEDSYGRVADRIHELDINELSQLNPHVEWVWELYRINRIIDLLVSQGFILIKISSQDQALRYHRWCMDNIPRDALISYYEAVFSTPDHAILCRLSA